MNRNGHNFCNARFVWPLAEMKHSCSVFPTVTIELEILLIKLRVTCSYSDETGICTELIILGFQVLTFLIEDAGLQSPLNPFDCYFLRAVLHR
jgi:hypothetical protein